MNLDDDLPYQLLLNLGLTPLEAKIYLTIATLEKAEVSKIAKTSNSARAEIYRILPRLEKLGLVEKILVTPTLYKAIPVKKGCYLLLEAKKSECEVLDKKIETIKNPSLEEVEFNQFSVTYSPLLNSKKITQIDSNYKKNWDHINVWNHFIRNFSTNTWKLHEKAIKRGAKIRIILDKNEKNKIVDRFLMKYPDMFELRCISSQVSTIMAIYDNTSAMLVTVDPNSEVHKEMPTLWSNNTRLIKVMSSYFEEMWRNAKEMKL